MVADDADSASRKAPGPVETRPVQARPVVAAIEGSTADDAVLDWAADEAFRAGTALTIVHVVDTSAQFMVPSAIMVESPALTQRLEEDGQEVLELAEDRVQARRPGLEVTQRFLRGAPAGALVELSGESRLLVVGAPEHRGLERMILGSVSLACVQHARCPVVVVPIDRPVPELSQIVVGVDSSPPSVRAVELALSLAAAAGASVTCVVGWNIEFVDGILVTEPGTEQWSRVQDRYAALVRQVVDPQAAEHPSVPVTVEVRPVWPAYAVLEAAVAVEADLVVVGSRGLGGFRGMLLGSVGKRVIEHAGRPVAVTR